MSSHTSVDLNEVAKLDGRNYSSWSQEFEAFAATRELLSYFEGIHPYPQVKDPFNKMLEEKQAINAWNKDHYDKATKLGGWIHLKVSPEQRVHLAGILLHRPDLMWTALQTVYIRTDAGACFNKLDELLDIVKDQDESVDVFVSRAKTLLRQLKDLCASGYTIFQLYDDLLAMSIIRGARLEYPEVVSNLRLSTSEITPDAAQTTLFRAEQDRLHDERKEKVQLAAQAVANAVSESTRRPQPGPSSLSSKKKTADLFCLFHPNSGMHVTDDCHRAKKLASRKGKESAQVAEAAEGTSEFAGKAGVHLI